MKILSVHTQEEFNVMIDNYDFRIVEAIVDGALLNLNTSKRFIHILSIEVQEDNDVYDLTLDRCEFLISLKKNLKYYEKKELFEKCQEIIEAIKFLEKKDEEKNKLNNKENPNNYQNLYNKQEK